MMNQIELVLVLIATITILRKGRGHCDEEED